MEDFDLKQERRYCARLGFAMLFVLLWTLVWQYGLLALDTFVIPGVLPDALYYGLILVGGYAVAMAQSMLTVFDCQPGQVMFSTSDVLEAIAFADRILVMAGGRITADLPAAEASEELLLRAANTASRHDQEPAAA